MLSIEEALDHIAAHVRPLASVRLPIGEALNHVLAEEITSDVDSPPHDKSVVDGFAVRAADVSSPDVRLSVIEEVFAGDVPRKSISAGAATRIAASRTKRSA